MINIHKNSKQNTICKVQWWKSCFEHVNASYLENCRNYLWTRTVHKPTRSTNL